MFFKLSATQFRERYGPWAVVTGASSGIGRSIAVQLAERKMNVVLIGRNAEVLKKLAIELTEQHGIECVGLSIDLKDEESLSEVIAAIGPLDVGLLVASAGFGTTGSFVAGDLRAEREMLAVNCRSLMELSWHFGRQFVARKRGGLVLLGSIVSFQGNPWMAHYAATKAYVLALGEALAIELSSQGVDVLTSCPGPTTSGFGERASIRMSQAMSSDSVARHTLAALGRRSTVLPGFLSKLLTYSLMPLPRWARVRIMGLVIRGSVK